MVEGQESRVEGLGTRTPLVLALDSQLLALDSSKWSHRELNPDFQHAELASSRWTMAPSVVSFLFEPATVSYLLFILRLETSFRIAHPPMGGTHTAPHVSATFASVFSSSAHSGPAGESNPDLLVAGQVSSRWSSRPSSQTSVRESTRSPSLPRRCATGTPTDRRVIPAGIEPALSCTSRRRLRHWTTGPCVSDRGRSRTCKITRLSTWSLCQFAYSAVAGPGVAPGRRSS